MDLYDVLKDVSEKVWLKWKEYIDKKENEKAFELAVEELSKQYSQKYSPYWDGIESYLTVRGFVDDVVNYVKNPESKSIVEYYSRVAKDYINEHNTTNRDIEESITNFGKDIQSMALELLIEKDDKKLKSMHIDLIERIEKYHTTINNNTYNTNHYHYHYHEEALKLDQSQANILLHKKYEELVDNPDLSLCEKEILLIEEAFSLKSLDGVFFYLACLYEKNNEHLRAIEFFIRDAEKYHYADSYNRAGGIWLKKGLYYRALDCFEKTLNISSEDENAIYNLSITYMNLRKYDKAFEYSKRLLESNETDVDVTNVYAHALINKEAKMINGGYTVDSDVLKTVESLLVKVYEKSPREVDTNVNLAYVFLLERKFDDAIKKLEALLQFYPENAFGWAILGNTYNMRTASARNKEKAIECLEKAYELTNDKKYMDCIDIVKVDWFTSVEFCGRIFDIAL